MHGPPPMHGQHMHGHQMHGQHVHGQHMHGLPMHGQPMQGTPMQGQSMSSPRLAAGSPRRPPHLDMNNVYPNRYCMPRYMHHHGAVRQHQSLQYHPAVQQHFAEHQRMPLATVRSSESCFSSEGIPSDEDPAFEDPVEGAYSSDEDLKPAVPGCTDFMCLLSGGTQGKLPHGVAYPAMAPKGLFPSPSEILPSRSEVNDAVSSVQCGPGDSEFQDKPYIPDPSNYDLDDYPEDQYGYNYPHGYNHHPGFAPGYYPPAGYYNHPNGGGYQDPNQGYNYPPGYNYPVGVPDAVLFNEYAHLQVSPMSYHESLFTAESHETLSDDEFQPHRKREDTAPPKVPTDVPFDEPLLSKISFIQERHDMSEAVVESFEMTMTMPDEDQNFQNDTVEQAKNNNLLGSLPSNETDESEDDIGLASYTPSVENALEAMAGKTRNFYNANRSQYNLLMKGQSIEEEDQQSDNESAVGGGFALADAVATVDEDYEEHRNLKLDQNAEERREVVSERAWAPSPSASSNRCIDVDNDAVENMRSHSQSEDSTEEREDCEPEEESVSDPTDAAKSSDTPATTTPRGARSNVAARRPCLSELEIKTMQTHPSFDEHTTPDGRDELMGPVPKKLSTPVANWRLALRARTPYHLEFTNNQSRNIEKPHSALSSVSNARNINSVVKKSPKSLETSNDLPSRPQQRMPLSPISSQPLPDFKELSIHDNCRIEKPYGTDRSTVTGPSISKRGSSSAPYYSKVTARLGANPQSSLRSDGGDGLTAATSICSSILDKSPSTASSIGRATPVPRANATGKNLLPSGTKNSQGAMALNSSHEFNKDVPQYGSLTDAQAQMEELTRRALLISTVVSAYKKFQT